MGKHNAVEMQTKNVKTLKHTKQIIKTKC